MEANENLLEEVAGRFSRLAAAGDALRPEDWPRLARAERDLWAALIREEERSPAREGAAGHPLLPPAQRWRRRLLEQGLDAPAREVERVLDGLHTRRLACWLDRNQPARLGDDPAAWFGRLRVTDSLERAALDPDRPLPPAGDLSQGRAALRAGLLRAVAATPPDAAQRRAWTDALVDTADEALTGVDELPPAHAATHLEALADELGWHLAQVETARGEARRRLARRRRRLAAEATERRLTGRLEQLFGARRVAWWERSVLLAILAVLGLMLVPVFVTLAPAGERRLLVLDSALCGFFLWDFAVKWTLVRGDLTWFRRHFLTDLLPALPFPLLLLGGEGQEGRGVLALRFLRLPRLARYVRVLLPLLRAARAAGFLLRGLDRLVRRYGRGLDFAVILHPTPAERRRSRARARSPLASLWRLVGQAEALWQRSFDAAPSPGALAAARLDVLRHAASIPWSPPEEARSGTPARGDVCADDLLDRLSAVPGEEIEGELGPEFVARVARAARALAQSPLRWLPILRAYVPRAPDGVTDADLCARLTRGAASRLRAHLDRLRWGGDLYGTMTPSDLVGQLGATLVRRTARPVVRLLVLGAAYLFLVLLFRLFDLDQVEVSLFGRSFTDWAARLSGLLGTTLFLVAGVCLLLLALGFWLQRLASDASAYYAQVASAQFLHLTEGVKVRRLERDAQLLAQRVFAPERSLAGDVAAPDEERRAFLAGVRRWLTEGAPVERSTQGFDPVARVVLLYRDVLDGALMAPSDTRNTSQLLGNLALKRMRDRSWRVSAADQRALARLDLVHRRALIGGPWMWFTLITRTTTQQTARLIVDYNEHALPLDELASTAPAQVERHRRWLASRSARPEELPAAALERRTQLTTAFTALHLLDDAPERDAAIEARFGPQVLALLRHDRRALFRRVFGTYPQHLQPSERRVLNPRDLYRRWIEGGRVVLLPLRLLGLGLRLALRGLGFLGGAVRRVRDPRLAYAGDERSESDFTAAARKIDRMRGPTALACVWQRVICDVEYLGIPLPGQGASGFRGSSAEGDLEFLAAPHAFRERVAAERARATADVQRLEAELQRGLWARASAAAGIELPATGPRLRALVVAYRADYHGLRTRLSAVELCREVLLGAAQGPALPPRVLPRLRLRRAFAAWWGAHGHGDPRARRRAWRAAEHDADGVAGALLTWHAVGPEAARAAGERVLVEVLRHPGQVTEQIVTLRAVQTLALIDLRNYREHVWRLGAYARDGELPGRAFQIDAGSGLEAYSKLPAWQ